LGLTPTLADYIEVHAERLAVSGKRPSSVQKETAYLKYWSKKLGHLRLNKIRPHHLSNILTELAGEGAMARALSIFILAPSVARSRVRCATAT
jgi:hypothetical protein